MTDIGLRGGHFGMIHETLPVVPDCARAARDVGGTRRLVAPIRPG